MKIKSVKLAQALPETSSNILFNKKPEDSRATGYEIEMADRGYLEVTALSGKRVGTKYLIFPANIAYIELEKEEKKTRLKSE